MPKNDYKLDLRLVKELDLGRLHIQGIIDVFNILNTENWGSYGTTFGSSTDLVPGLVNEPLLPAAPGAVGLRATF